MQPRLPLTSFKYTARSFIDDRNFLFFRDDVVTTAFVSVPRSNRLFDMSIELLGIEGVQQRWLARQHDFASPRVCQFDSPLARVEQKVGRCGQLRHEIARPSQ